MKIFNKIRDAINWLQMKVYGWMPKDKQLHLFAGIMTFLIAHLMFSLSLGVSMVIVTLVGLAKEVFDVYRHNLGFSKGYFDYLDLVATVSGGAIILVIELIITFIMK